VKFEIKKVSELKFINKETNEPINLNHRDKPIKKEIDYNLPIIELLRRETPTYELSTLPLFKKYGYDTFGSICEGWYWGDNLKEATELELWKMFAMCSADWGNTYKYWYYEKEYQESLLKEPKYSIDVKLSSFE